MKLLLGLLKLRNQFRVLATPARAIRARASGESLSEQLIGLVEGMGMPEGWQAAMG